MHRRNHQQYLLHAYCRTSESHAAILRNKSNINMYHCQQRNKQLRQTERNKCRCMVGAICAVNYYTCKNILHIVPRVGTCKDFFYLRGFKPILIFLRRNCPFCKQSRIFRTFSLYQRRMDPASYVSTQIEIIPGFLIAWMNRSRVNVSKMCVHIGQIMYKLLWQRCHSNKIMCKLLWQRYHGMFTNRKVNGNTPLKVRHLPGIVTMVTHLYRHGCQPSSPTYKHAIMLGNS